jgi:hypothetical protein
MTSDIYDQGRYWLLRHSRLWLPLAVVIGLLVASVYVAPHVPLIYGFLPLAVAGVLVLLRWPALGIVTLIPASLYVPIAVNTGTETRLSAPVLLTGLLAGLWLFDMVVRQRRLYLLPSRPLLPLFALVVVVMLAFLAGQLPWFPFAEGASMAAQLGGVSVFVLSALVFTLVAYQVQELRWLQYTTWLFLLLGGIYIAGRFLPALGTARWLQRGGDGSLFWTWLAAMALGQALFNRELKAPWRLLLLALAIATPAAGWLLDRHWVSGWLPPLVALTAVVYLRSWRLGLLLSLLAIGAKLITDPGLLNELLARDEYSIQTRFLAWEIILGSIFRANPVLGLGPANYYHYTPLFPILGWYVQFNSHNQYVDLLAQTGILGLLCFLWFSGEVARLGWRLRDRVSPGFAQAYVYAALGGLAGTLAAGMLGDWILPFVYNIGLFGFRASGLAWLFLGGVVALEQMLPPRAQAAPAGGYLDQDS